MGHLESPLQIPGRWRQLEEDVPQIVGNRYTYAGYAAKVFYGLLPGDSHEQKLFIEAEQAVYKLFFVEYL
jgi:hypothetical protein